MSEQQKRTPADAYESFLVPALFTPWARLLVERAAPHEGERVLDLACGTGVVSREVAPHVGPRGRVTGVDFSSDMLAVARSRPSSGASIQWRECDACALDLPDRSVDVVLCQQGLQFFPDRAAAAREIHRVLADDGRAVIAVWQSLTRHEVFQALFSAESHHLQVPLEQLATPFSLPAADALRTLLTNAGFSDVAIESVSLDVHFPSADQWIEQTVRAGAAVMSHLAQEDEALTALLDTVRRESAAVVERYRSGAGLTFPTYSHLAIARK